MREDLSRIINQILGNSQIISEWSDIWWMINFSSSIFSIKWGRRGNESRNKWCQFNKVLEYILSTKFKKDVIKDKEFVLSNSNLNLILLDMIDRRFQDWLYASTMIHSAQIIVHYSEYYQYYVNFIIQAQSIEKICYSVNSFLSYLACVVLKSITFFIS
jgi:hypothetical protein